MMHLVEVHVYVFTRGVGVRSHKFHGRRVFHVERNICDTLGGGRYATKVAATRKKRNYTQLSD